MFDIGEIISYLEMCSEEKVNLQRGMNFRLGKTYSVILMSVQKNAPCSDRIENNGKTLIYEGHDIPNRRGGPDPKSVDQQSVNPGGTLTQNGLFFKGVDNYNKNNKAEVVRVYEKIRPGIWTFSGFFNLLDAWKEESNKWFVYKFRLELIEHYKGATKDGPINLNHNRIIPAQIKREVWKRDNGACIECGSKDNLHFDHIIPFSKGGSSLISENIQILCARHNLNKRDHIQ